jgi:hypothetical protein
MSNKTQLQTNNTNLQSFIDRVNAAKDIAASLPEASGGLDINGIIKEYQVYAGENISAGDFVEFINAITTQSNLVLNNTSYSCYEEPSCILLEDNKVFIAHSYSSSEYLYGTIVEINGTTMTATTTQLSSTLDSCHLEPSCILLEKNKVFIAHSNRSVLYGTIVKINGTAMTPTTTQLGTFKYKYYDAPDCILLDANRVFITYSNDFYLYGTIVRINGTAMTPTTTQLSSARYSCYDVPSCILLEDNKVFIAHSYGDYEDLYGTIVEINGTTMTPTTTQLSSISGSCFEEPSCILLENNKVFIAHKDASEYYLYGTIVEINGTTMTPTTTQLSSTSYSCFLVPSCILLEDNKVFIAHFYSSDRYLYGTTVKIDGTKMTATSNQLSSTSISSSYFGAPNCILLDANRVFITYSSDTLLYLHGTIVFNNTYAKPYETIINGIAKTSGADGETIEIYVPN